MEPPLVPSRTTLDLLAGILMTLAVFAGLVWFLWRTLKRTEDPPRLVFKWVLSLLALAIEFRYVAPAIARGGFEGAFFGVPATAVFGLVMAIIWRHNIAMLIARPFASLYDGGSVEPDPKPAYSTALARRKRGDYLAAREEVRAQLRRFPADVEGQMLLAEIEAQDLHDLRAADVVIQRFIAQKGHAPANIAYALNTMADWHLKFAQDRDAARDCFEKIGALLPDSEWAQRAAQRIAHLGTTDLLLGSEARRTFAVPHIEGDPGLQQHWGANLAPQENGEDLADRYVRHLVEFPHDTEIREQLARLYAGHYQRLDLAADQLEQLIQFPNQPPRQIVRWLNILADLQVKCGADYDAVRATLQRIIDLYPDAASATIAQNRIELLRLEFKGKEKSQAVSLGSYEDDLGLKGNLPR